MSSPALHYLLTLLLSLLLQVQGDSSLSWRRFNALKFGDTQDDYVMYKPDMTPLESAFTICAWVRKLGIAYAPTWFSYGVRSNSHEIQITDMGGRTRLFGDDTDVSSVYTVPEGTWFHNCMSWSAASQARYVYINGVVVDARGTPAGRKLQMDGYLLIGNELDRYGTGMDDYNIFAGELYKLNVFSRMLTTSEIKEMSSDMCSTVEESYCAERHIRWEDLLQVSRTGNVSEMATGCTTVEIQMMTKLEQIEDKLNKTLAELATAAVAKEKLKWTEGKLNDTIIELTETKDMLESTKVNHNKTLAKLAEQENMASKLNKTLSDLAAAKRETFNTESKYNTTATELAETKDMLAITKVSHDKTLAKLAASTAEQEKMASKLNTTLRNLAAANRNILNTEAKYNTTATELAETKDILENTESTLNETLAELSATTTKQEETEEQLNDTRTALTNTMMGTERTAGILSETATKLYDTLIKVEELVDEVLSISKKAEELEEEMDSCYERVDELEEEMTSCSEEVEVAKSGCHGCASKRNLDN